MRQIELLSKSKGAQYSIQDLTMALTLCSKSRCVYRDLRKVMKLPSIRLLQQMTSRVDKICDEDYLRSALQKSPHKECLLLLGEVYVKVGLQFSGGVVHGYAENQAGEKARTILAAMICLLNSGQKFVYKLHPVAKLTSEFQSNIINKVIADLCIVAAIPVGVVMDNNRVNQVCLSSFRADKPFYGLV